MIADLGEQTLRSTATAVRRFGFVDSSRRDLFHINADGSLWFAADLTIDEAKRVITILAEKAQR